VGNILRRYGIQPAPKRSQNTTWKDFIASHMAVLAGTDFFTVEVLTWRGLATLDNLPLPASVGQTKVGGIDFNKPRMRQVAEAVLAMSTSPTSPAGFTASDLAQKVRKMNGQAEADYRPRRAVYDIKKLRANGMVRKIGTSRRYESVPEGLRAIAALVVLREKVIRPLLAASQRPEPTSKPNHPTRVDQHYEHLRVGMRDLLTALGMVA
jgi:hypothetical protein